jgi:hypothetical protein
VTLVWPAGPRHAPSPLVTYEKGEGRKCISGCSSTRIHSQSKTSLPGQDRLEGADLEIRVRQKLDIHRQPIVLPQQHPTTLSRAGEVAQNGKSELPEGRTGLDHAHEQRYYARLCGLLLSTLIQSTEVVACLEYVIGHFLAKWMTSVRVGDRTSRRVFDDIPHYGGLSSARLESGSKSRWHWHSAELRATAHSWTGA